MVNYKIYSLSEPITNEIRYIGLTFNTLKQRLKSHYHERGKSHKCNWVNSLKSRGLKPLINLIEEGITSYEECCDRETYYIDKYRQDGYNLTNMSSGGNKNKKMSLETRQKMSKARIEFLKNNPLIHSVETREKIKFSSILRFMNEYERERLRISNSIYEHSKTDEEKFLDILKQPNRKLVKQYDMNMIFIKEYPSINNASKINNIENSNIIKCCKHEVPSAGGYIWRYENDKTPPTYNHGKKVYQYDKMMNLINIFDNARIASGITQINESSIRKCCNDKQSHAGGYIWKYII